MTNTGIDGLQARVAKARERVITHPLYASLDNWSAIHTFMEHHVFAVWDFMSLLKSLQRDLTCVSVPWVPVGATGTRRFINDIVLVEESDELHGRYSSHFELYLAAMAEAGADTSVIERFIERIGAGESVLDAVEGAPVPAARFVRSTWDVVQSAPLHSRAAAFAFGREDLIPEMFTRVVAVHRSAGGLDTFIEYLQRHIEVDGEDHSPMALQMIADLCGDNEESWRECAQAAEAAIAGRFQLWDGILAAIKNGTVEHDSRLVISGRSAY